MHIDDETLDALGYACPERDDVCTRMSSRAEAAERDRDRYQTRRLDPWYMSRCRASRAAGAQRAGTLAPGGAVVTVLDVVFGGALVCAVLVAGLWRYLTGAL